MSDYQQQNKAIDEYYRVILNGLLAAGLGGREDSRLYAKAMSMAVKAYEHRRETLGQTHAKKLI